MRKLSLLAAMLLACSLHEARAQGAVFGPAITVNGQVLQWHEDWAEYDDFWSGGEGGNYGASGFGPSGQDFRFNLGNDADYIEMWFRFDGVGTYTFDAAASGHWVDHVNVSPVGPPAEGSVLYSGSGFAPSGGSSGQADVSLLVAAAEVIAAVVAGSLAVFGLAMGWPVAVKVYGAAKRILTAS